MGRFKIYLKKNLYDIIVYHETDFEYLDKWIFKPINLKAKIRKPGEFILSPAIIFHILKNFNLLRFNNFFHRLKIIYELSILDYYRPKFVFTFIDNNALFKNLSKIDFKRKYFALQNGTRFDWVINAVGKSKMNRNKNRMIYFSFGEYEKNLFKNFGDYNCNVIPVGSFRSSINKHYRNDVKKKYDICIVSTMINFSEDCDLANLKIERARLLYPVKENEFYLIWKKLSTHLKRYINDKNISAIIPLRYTNNKFEKDFFKTRFNKNCEVKERTKFGTYHAMNNSEIIISVGCTTLLEAIGLGKKILQVDFSKTHHWTAHYKETITNLNNDSYEYFKKKMDYLFSISHKQYQNEIKEYSNYLINYNQNIPTYKMIQTELKRFL